MPVHSASSSESKLLHSIRHMTVLAVVIAVLQQIYNLVIEPTDHIATESYRIQLCYLSTTVHTTSDTNAL
jgi:hypothetical protein